MYYILKAWQSIKHFAGAQAEIGIKQVTSSNTIKKNDFERWNFHRS